jgi:hypothetical protein
LFVACPEGAVRSAGTLPGASAGDSQATDGDTDFEDDTDRDDCSVDPGDGWTISAASSSLDFAHRGVTDFTMSDAGARVGSGAIDSAVIGSGNLYVDGRMGVETNYWMKQAQGDGAAFSVGTANDHFAVYVENESGDNNSNDSVSIFGGSVTPRSAPRVNIGGHFSAANAPAGNIGMLVDAQYSPSASPPNQTLVLREMSGDTPLYVGYFNPNYFDAHDGAYAVSGFDIRINTAAVATFTTGGMYASSYNVWSSRTLKSGVEPVSDADRAAMAEAVEDLRVVRFRYLDDPGGKQHVGLIAEEAPAEMVDAAGRAVRLPETVAYLVAANQELSADNKELRDELAALRRDVEALRASPRR